MDQPLIDREGFPRSDIDLVAVRTARHSIIGMGAIIAGCILHASTGLPGLNPFPIRVDK
jgi:hypothetical protein